MPPAPAVVPPAAVLPAPFVAALLVPPLATVVVNVACERQWGARSPGWLVFCVHLVTTGGVLAVKAVGWFIVGVMFIPS